MYKAIEHKNHSAIYKGGVLVSWSVLGMRNSFWTLAEAQQVADELNKVNKND